MTKKSFFKTFLISSFLFFISLFTSCKVEWFGGLEDDLDEKLMTFVDFYPVNIYTVTSPPDPLKIPYLIGTELTQDDFPQTGSKELYKLRPGYHLTGKWKYGDALSNDIVSRDPSTYVVERCVVPPKDTGIYLVFYLDSTDWAPNTDTKYTFHYKLQNIYDNEYDEFDKSYSGTTDDPWLVNQVTEYQNMVGSPLSGSTTTGIYEHASNHDESFTIAGDGSTKINVTLYRNVRSLTFNLDSSSLLPESWTDSVTDPPVDPQGIITKTKESNKYTIKCRHGYDYKRLKEDIQQLRPAKNNYGFYGWTNEGSSSIVCGLFENPYDFILSFDDASNPFPDSVEGDKVFYPVWGPEFYKIYIKMPQMKDDEFIGTIDGIDILSDSDGKYINISAATPLPPPQLPDSYKTEDFEFAGYKYTNLLDLSGGISLISQPDGTWNAIGLSTPIANLGVITATWTYKNIYLDPVGGNDNNDGLSAGTAVQSVSKAKELAKDEMTNASGNSIYLMNKITQTDDLNALNNTTTSTYHYVSIKRAEGVKGTLIEIPSGTTFTWNSITFDGNKDKVIANSPFIVNSGNLTLNQDINVENLSSEGSVEKGAVVKNTGTLTVGKNIFAGTQYNYFKNIYSKKGGLFYNDGSSPELYIDVNNQFTDCTCDSSATALDQRANIAYIRQGKLILRSKAFTENFVIALNKTATIQHNSAVDGSDTIATLVLGDENATGTLSDFDTSMSHELLTTISTSVDLAEIAPRFVLPDSTYNASTSTAGWKIDENGKLVYVTFVGGQIINPLDFSAKFCTTFKFGSNNSATDDWYSGHLPPGSVITVTELPCTIGIILEVQYQETRKFRMSLAQIQNLSNPSSSYYDSEFTGLEVKLYYSMTDTGAVYDSSTGTIKVDSTYPPGEYTLYIYFEYMGVPYSIYIPFTVDY